MNEKLEYMFSQVLQLRPVHTDLTSDEKRIKRVFSENNLYLRWNRCSSQYQVWYKSPKQCYCILSIPSDSYSAGKAIAILKQREKSRRQTAQEYQKELDRLAIKEDEELDDRCIELAKGVNNIEKGKIAATIPDINTRKTTIKGKRSTFHSKAIA